MLKKAISILTVIFIGNSFLSVSAYAKNRDFYDMKNKKVFKSDIWRNSDEEFNKLLDEIMERPDDFSYEFKGKTYNYIKLSENISKEHKKGLTYTDAFINSLSVKEIQEDIPSFNEHIKFEVISID